jgi:hypothetical protein
VAHPGCARKAPTAFIWHLSGFAARCRRDTKPKKIRANCVSGLFSVDGGLKAACRHYCLPHKAAECMP